MTCGKACPPQPPIFPPAQAPVDACHHPKVTLNSPDWIDGASIHGEQAHQRQASAARPWWRRRPRRRGSWQHLAGDWLWAGAAGSGRWATGSERRATDGGPRSSQYGRRATCGRPTGTAGSRIASLSARTGHCCAARRAAALSATPRCLRDGRRLLQRGDDLSDDLSALGRRKHHRLLPRGALDM